MIASPSNSATVSEPVKSWREWTQRTIDSPLFGRVVLIAILLCECLSLVVKASRRPFWYDELFTLHVSRLEPFSRLYEALQAGVDAIPPTYFFIVSFAGRIPTNAELAMRLPSIAGYLVAISCVYWFARRWVAPSLALGAVLLLCLSPFRHYATEARPYAVWLGSVGLAAALWQRLDTGGWWRIVTFGLCLTLSVSLHHFAIFVVGCFLAAELVYSLLSRRVRWQVWLACLIAAIPFFASLPLLLQVDKLYAARYFSETTAGTALFTYSYLSGLGYTVGAVSAGLICIMSVRFMWRHGSTNVPVAADLTLTMALLLYPVILVVLVLIRGGGYVPRYAMVMLLALVWGLSFLLRDAPRVVKISLTGLLFLMFVQQARRDVALASPLRSGVDPRAIRLADLAKQAPELPIAMASGIDYLQIQHYSTAELRSRLVHVADVQCAIRFSGTDSVDRNMLVASPFWPVRTESRSSFLARYPAFLVHSGGSHQWILDYLLEHRYRIELLSREPGWSLYRVERSAPCQQPGTHAQAPPC